MLGNMSPHTPQAVVFDMDGLMFNTEDVYWHVGSEVLRRRGREYTRELCHAMMGCTPRSAFEIMIRWHALDDSCEQLAIESEEVFIRLLDDYLAPMPGLLDLLSALETAAIPKAIATSSQPRLVDAVLTRFEMQPRFRFILTADDVVHGKPAPEIYLKAAERFGILPGAMLVLEDSQNGCRAAAAAGAFTVAVPGEHSRTQDFTVADMVIESLADPRLHEVLGVAGREKKAGGR
jgi:HAD superfamily hydrolase (TIGR01509 family)